MEELERYEGSDVQGSELSVELRNELHAELCDAVEAGNMLAAEYLIKAGANLEALDENGLNVLHYAVDRGRPWLFLYYGAKPTVRDRKNGETPLHRAARGKPIRFLEVFGFNLDNLRIRDKHGRTPLHSAIEAGSPKMSIRILEYGAEINAADEAGMTPLHYTVKSPSQDMYDLVQHFLRYGADPNLRDTAGKTALHYASQTDSQGEVELLAQAGTHINAADEIGNTALHYATLSGSTATASILIGYGADLFHQNRSGQTALHCAALSGSPETVELLLSLYKGGDYVIPGRGISRNSDPETNFQPANRETLALEHLSSSKTPSSSSPIKRDSYVDELDANFQTALHCAVRFAANAESVTAIIRTLTASSADVNIADKDGKTILHHAAELALGDACDEILRHNPDVNVIDKQGRTVLHYTITSKLSNLVEKLLSCGADVNVADKDGRTALLAAMKSRLSSIVIRLCESGADIEARNNKAQTALHIAAQVNAYDTIDYLADRINFNAADLEGRTALHVAAEFASPLFVEKIIRRVDISARDYRGQTALHYAARIQNPGVMVNLLLRNGSGVNDKDMQEKTALFYAVESDEYYAVRALIAAGADRTSPLSPLLRPDFGQSEFPALWGRTRGFAEIWNDKWVCDDFAPSMFSSTGPNRPSIRVMEWQIPAFIHEGRDKSVVAQPTPIEFLRHAIVITGYGDALHVNTCEAYLSGRYGAVGLDALQYIASALLAPGNPIVEKSPSHIVRILAQENFLAMWQLRTPETVHLGNALADAILWLCQALRPRPLKSDGRIVISETLQEWKCGSFVQIFSLKPFEDLDATPFPESSCWTDLFKYGLIVSETLNWSWGKGLKIPFGLMVKLAGVQNFSYVEDSHPPSSDSPKGGYIMIGLFTALIPMAENESKTAIQWHFISTRDEQRLITIADIERIGFHPVDDISRLQNVECFVGWCESANILLGTEKMDYNVQPCSLRLRRRDRSLHKKGFTVALQAGIPIPSAPTLQGQANFDYVRNIQRYRPADDYASAVLFASKEVALVLDTKAERAWFVPKLSLILHMCHVFYRTMVQPPGPSPIPYAEASPDGARAAREALIDKGDMEVFTMGGDHVWKLSNVLVQVNLNLSDSGATREKPQHLKILASEFLDAIRQPSAGGRLVEVPTHGLARPWHVLVGAADYVCACSDLGLAIEPESSSSICDCKTLNSGCYYLGAHVQCLKDKFLPNRQLQNSEIAIEGELTWRYRRTVCAHTGRYWKHPQAFLQIIAKRTGEMDPRLVSAAPVTGAVVFGEYRSNSFTTLFSRLHSGGGASFV